MDKFLKIHKTPKLTQEETDTISKSIIRGWVSNQTENSRHRKTHS